MEKQAEDFVLEKEFEYTHGFLDALNLVISDANPILTRVPEKKRLDVLMAMIDWLHCEALEKHTENTRVIMNDGWNLEFYLRQEGIPLEKYQSDEKHETEANSAASLCPSGCGTELVKRKFVDIFDENKKAHLQDVEEDFYCPRCQIRWIQELHPNLFEMSPEFAAEIEKYAKLEGLSTAEFIEKTTKEHFEKVKKLYPDKGT
jgi:hypothetical protein